jgi:hypothetical protein
MDIEDLYGLLPDFICNPGCIECCRLFGVATRTRVEDERIKEYLREHGMEEREAQGTTCPFVTEKGCSIHPVRPLICRLYGTSPNYRCREGVTPLRCLHEDEEEDIFHFYRANFF